MLFGAALRLARLSPPLRGRTLKRLARLALCGVVLGGVTGCVVAPVPGPRVGYYRPGVVWVPAHWSGWRWVRGHWA
jgi:hypothetical protein